MAAQRDLIVVGGGAAGLSAAQYGARAGLDVLVLEQLASGGQALKALSSEERSRVKLIMISVDPQRDTFKHLKEYTAFFHPEMIGATGTVEEIATLARAYGAGYMLQPKRADGSYAVDHTTSTYVVGPDGKLASVLELGAPTDKVVAAVRKLL